MNRQYVREPGARSRAAAMCAAMAVCAVAVMPGQARAAGEPSPYVFQPGAERITGAATTSEADKLVVGTAYRDSIGPAGRLIYRIDLDAETNTYVSVVAVPKQATKVDSADAIKISLQNSQGTNCTSNEARFGGVGEFPRPLAAYAYRTVEKGSYSCREAGPYYVVVERAGEETSTPEPWELEIRPVSEPVLVAAGPTRAPSRWPSASPGPLTEASRERAGGTSFYDAKGLSTGEWTTEIDPGASLFYRIPVDWGQQLFVGADLSSSAGPGTGTGAVSGAFTMSLYNPARGLVGGSGPVSYDGRQKAAAIGPLPPVAYENRFGYRTGDKDMRFAGWYYLRVSLNPEVGESFGAKPYGLTLRVNVRGEAEAGPGYAGPAGDFGVTPTDREQAEAGRSGPDAAAGSTMKVVAAAGIGTGTVLVLGLGVWTLLARRHGGPSAVPEVSYAASPVQPVQPVQPVSPVSPVSPTGTTRRRYEAPPGG
ncbi:hypothetical protein [Streptomyces sp. NPDC088554]|uniref:hypothetical protein n=1 Tax=Streptomyces sp. NPDC088554 TaxID=3365865 RepID=UPI0038235D09